MLRLEKLKICTDLAGVKFLIFNNWCNQKNCTILLRI